MDGLTQSVNWLLVLVVVFADIEPPSFFFPFYFSSHFQTPPTPYNPYRLFFHLLLSFPLLFSLLPLLLVINNDLVFTCILRKTKWISDPVFTLSRHFFVFILTFFSPSYFPHQLIHVRHYFSRLLQPREPFSIPLRTETRKSFEKMFKKLQYFQLVEVRNVFFFENLFVDPYNQILFDTLSFFNGETWEISSFPVATNMLYISHRTADLDSL